MSTTTAPEPEVTSLLLAGYQKALGHEIPNLLVAGQGLARLLMMEIQDPEQHGLLDRLAQGLQRCDSLVRRLAALGRTLRSAPRWERCSLGELVEEIAAELRTTRGLTPIRPASNHLPTRLTDRDRLRQVLLAVLRNAAQAARPSEPLAVQCTWNQDEQTLDILDNGQGLPDRPLETFLQPFPPGSVGQGLGLFSSDLLLRTLGGRLTLVRSHPGTLVRVFLPEGDANS